MRKIYGFDATQGYGFGGGMGFQDLMNFEDLLDHDNAVLAASRSSVTDNGDDTYTLTCTDDSSTPYGYLRMSLTGSSPDLIRDLVGGERLVSTIRVKASDTGARIYSPTVNVDSGYSTKVDTWETFSFDELVDDPISNTAFIGFYFKKEIGATMTVDLGSMRILGESLVTEIIYTMDEIYED